MSTKNDLDRMKRSWESLGISRRFSSVHHFASDKFATKTSGLKGFYNWCKEREILDENSQTLKRAIKVSSLVESGKGIDAAIAQAWTEFPVCKR